MGCRIHSSSSRVLGTLLRGALLILFTASAGVFADGTWRATAPMHDARFRHTATLLNSCHGVLAAGGTGASGQFLSSAEIFNLAGGWSSVGPLNTARSSHTATLLPSGLVLITGGEGQAGILASAELFDPDAQTWIPTGTMANARIAHTATLLANGLVLVAGGRSPAGALASAEVYDPATGIWAAVDPMPVSRSSHAAVLLPSGRALLLGGSNATGTLDQPVTFDPSTRRWSASGSISPREGHTLTLPSSGPAPQLVLMVGGTISPSLYVGPEVYDADAGRVVVGSAAFAVFSLGMAATALPDGNVFVVGGDLSGTTAWLFNPWGRYPELIGDFTPIEIGTHLMDGQATLLPSASVLVSGGSSATWERSGVALAECYLFTEGP